jgi:hypothetical protein
MAHCLPGRLLKLHPAEIEVGFTLGADLVLTFQILTQLGLLRSSRLKREGEVQWGEPEQAYR